MFIIMVVIFVMGYSAIALEHPLKVNKAAPALLTGMILWALYALFNEQILELGFSPAFKAAQEMAANIKDYIASNVNEEHFKHLWEELSVLTTNSPEHGHYMEFVKHDLGHHLNDIAQILFFLLGAMTIVETVDRYQGFRLITDKIKTTNPAKLAWILGFITFFMSAALDNLTSTIVMIALLRKLVDGKDLRWLYASIIVIAANSGGAWSPIGDVTTIMLWIGGNITAGKIIAGVFLPSLVSMVVPLIFVSFMLKGKEIVRPVKPEGIEANFTSNKERTFMLVLGVSALLFVPIFKTITHLPPYIGMLFGLGMVWLATEIILRRHQDRKRGGLSVLKILEHVDVPTIFFFLGILMAVAALQSAGHLDLLAKWLDKSTGQNVYIIDTLIGILSSIVDNVPLVASAMGMYPITDIGHFAQDGLFWELLAFTAGTGGSMLIIGSAAGVAAMGLEKIDFIWYAKKITWLAAVGYFAGIAVYYVQEVLFHING
ncbi:MAG: sodium:proton antiporter NhaD [Bacteroidales bacterium]|nr:sodium:proton antiporter NhaD [Bacteroidales bacterium]